MIAPAATVVCAVVVLVIPATEIGDCWYQAPY